MGITSSVDCAIKILICLAKSGGYVPSSTLVQYAGCSKRCLLQTASKLRLAGLVAVRHGIDGGYRLILAPQEISILDIFRIFGARPRRRTAQSDCFTVLEQKYAYFARVFEQELGSVTIADVLPVT